MPIPPGVRKGFKKRPEFEELSVLLRKENLSYNETQELIAVLDSFVEAAGARKIGAEVFGKLLKNLPPERQKLIAENIANGFNEGHKAVKADILIELLKDSGLSSEVLEAVAESAGEIGGSEGARVLEEVLKRKGLSYKVLEAVAKSAGEIEVPEGIGVLKEVLKRDNEVLKRDNLRIDMLLAVVGSLYKMGQSVRQMTEND